MSAHTKKLREMIAQIRDHNGEPHGLSILLLADALEEIAISLESLTKSHH